jgi:pilus assembly protein CpaB
MNPRTLILALVALSIAGATALFARHWLESQRAVVVATAPAPTPTVESTEVLVAKESIPAGTFVKRDHLRWQPWPDNGVAESYAVKGKADMADFVGAVVRQGITAGEPITSFRVVRPGDRGFLAAVLKPGTRAVSVSVSPETGISGLVFPGDRVDLILAQGFREINAEQAPMRRASETVLTDIRVIAIDQKTNDQNEKAAVVKTVTLEVTPKQAERVAVAAELGKLSLSLRSLAIGEDVAAADTRGPTWDSEVSNVVAANKKVDNAIDVVHGSKAETVAVKDVSPGKAPGAVKGSKAPPPTAALTGAPSSMLQGPARLGPALEGPL